MRRSIALLFILIVVIAGGCSGGEHGAKEKDIYYCPMHPTYTSDRPGDCPICNMKLKKKERGEKIDKAQESLPGSAVVNLSLQRQQMINIKTGKAAMRLMEKEIRTVGRVEYDERKVALVNTKYSGWIEELYADYTGKHVNKGDPLLAIYSPDLVATQEELLTALQGKETAEKGGAGQLAINTNRLYESAKQKLLYWDISEEQIAALEKSRTVSKRMTVAAPIGGHVVEKQALAGKFVMAGENLYQIADLSTIWITADIYEYELPYIKEGMEATVELSYLPGESFKGKVAYIYPYLTPSTRTAKVRFELANDGGKLKPGMFANVKMAVDLGKKLSVPESAVIDSGKQQVLFIAKQNGYFEPRAVKLGAKIDDYYEVLDGVYEGEDIVSSGTFLLDSESKLQYALNAMESANEGKQPPEEHKGHR